MSPRVAVNLPLAMAMVLGFSGCPSSPAGPTANAPSPSAPTATQAVLATAAPPPTVTHAAPASSEPPSATAAAPAPPCPITDAALTSGLSLALVDVVSHGKANGLYAKQVPIETWSFVRFLTQFPSYMQPGKPYDYRPEGMKSKAGARFVVAYTEGPAGKDLPTVLHVTGASEVSADADAIASACLARWRVLHS